MTRHSFSGRGRFGAGAFAVLLALAALPALAGAQSVEEKYQLAKRRASAFNLTAGPTAVLQVNKFQCGLINNGSTCTDVFNSPTGGGGFWPTGTPDQYMFNSGIQVVGIIPSNAGFTWAGDTVGAFFMDASGLRQHGTAVTQIYNSLDPADLAVWPDKGAFPDFPEATAWVTDTELFNDVLIGRKAASQQDSWVMYWDGDPGPSGGRVHPMGILVEQRTLAWNYPAGNEAIIYFVYKFTNITNNRLFQRLNETQFFGGANMLPDAGWRFDSVYVAYDSDPDVTADFNKNYATGILPFNLGLSYEGTFFEPAFDYPPSEFFPPFFTNAPGLVGIKYLKSPVDPATGNEVGLTSLSLHTNGAPFNDPLDVKQGWRYISLNIDAGKGDPQCTFPLSEVKQRRACFLGQNQSDVRFFIGSGPFSLDPGQSATVAVAMYAAATVATPLITPSNSADNKPGFPGLKPGCPGDPLRPIDVASGWLRTNVCPTGPNELVDQHDVDVVPGSLLGKALVAQAIFDNKFLLGFAPETPTFYLVPGDNQITVVWEPSRTEQDGDPFFSAAGDPSSPLYDPNYREKDVEGYRVYRGTTPANLTMVAQFDKKGSVYTDHLCITDPTFVTGEPCDEVHEVPLSGTFIQYPPGGVVELADGSKLVVKADTALGALISSGAATPLSDTGIPFAYVDKGVRNGFPYFYKVTAFDINSLRSGPSSLESAGPPKQATPRRASPNLVVASFESFMAGKDGQPLNPNAPLPAIDAAKGTFSGPMPPTNSAEAVFLPLVERLLPKFRLEAVIDSVVGDNYITGCPETGGSPGFGSCWHLYMTFDLDGQKQQSHVEGWSPVWSSFDGTDQSEFIMGQKTIAADAAALSQFSIPGGSVGFDATLQGRFLESIRFSSNEGQANRRFGSSRYAGGSRWFNGTQETLADPTTFIHVGHLEGVDSVWAAIHHTPFGPGLSTYGNSGQLQCLGYGYAFLGRAADVRLTWSGGKPAVLDVTHNVDVPFKPNVQASFGFLNTDADGDGVVGWNDFMYIDNISPLMEDFGFCGHSDDPSKYVKLEAAPRMVPVSVEGNAEGSIDQTGTGFGLYINGERYIFQMSALPADNTVWTLRSYSGNLTASGANTADPSGYAFTSLDRSPLIPGLRFVWQANNATELIGDPDLGLVHTVPDPYYAVSQFDLGPSNKELKFVNLPAKATIRIYSMSGILVDIVNHDDTSGGGSAPWDLRNRSGQFVASGVYFYHVSTPDGKSIIRKFTVVNSGFAR